VIETIVVAVEDVMIAAVAVSGTIGAVGDFEEKRAEAGGGVTMTGGLPVGRWSRQQA
jgi:hypothetical protein